MQRLYLVTPLSAVTVLYSSQPKCLYISAYSFISVSNRSGIPIVSDMFLAYVTNSEAIPCPWCPLSTQTIRASKCRFFAYFAFEEPICFANLIRLLSFENRIYVLLCLSFLRNHRCCTRHPSVNDIFCIM